MQAHDIQAFYNKNGWVKLEGFFNAAQLSPIKQVVQTFHHAWCKDNAEFYAKQAINSSGLTSGQYLSEQQRFTLFALASQKQVVELLQQITPNPIFVGTQLFFDPKNPQQANYWHRDPQYDLTLAQQKLALAGPAALHLRIPLTSEPGIELIPGSHKHWDTEEELAVRLELNGHRNSEDLSNGLKIPLALGDVLVFSANMIHRGLYGDNRLALDLLYGERHATIIKFIQKSHLPTAEMLNKLTSDVFLQA